MTFQERHSNYSIYVLIEEGEDDEEPENHWRLLGGAEDLEICLHVLHHVKGVYGKNIQIKDGTRIVAWWGPLANPDFEDLKVPDTIDFE